MVETSFSELRQNLKQFCDQTVADREPVRVRRPRDGDVVVLAAEEFESLAETAHLLASPENAARLITAIARARRGTSKPMTVGKLREAIGL
jgi:antitoxin YefM